MILKSGVLRSLHDVINKTKVTGADPGRFLAKMYVKTKELSARYANELDLMTSYDVIEVSSVALSCC